jgi:hypothetical protein
VTGEERAVVSFPGGKRGYSWPPFQKGHELSMRHGAWSPRKVEPLAGEHAERLLAQASAPQSPVAYLADPTYRPTVWAWARTEARIQLLSEWLIDRGSEVDDKGEAVGAANLLNQLESRAESLRARLGLDPLSRARLGRDVAAAQVDVAALMAQLDDDDGDG